MIFRFGTAPCSHRPTKQQSTTAFSHLFLMRRCPLWGLSDAVKIHKARNPAESVGKCRHGDETYKGRQSTAARRLSGQEVGASSRAGNKQNKSTQGLRSSSVIRPRKFQAARGRRMSTRVVGESRRSTRVPLQILITLLSLDEPLTCEGETITVNRHGALISSSVPLRIETKIAIQVVPTNKRGLAKVIYVDPDHPRVCGIALEKPQNIWGVSFPPEDWCEDSHES